MKLFQSVNKHKEYILPLTIIVAAGYLLRLYGLDNQSLWNDELSSWMRSNYGNLSEVFEKGVKNDVHPPGYQILLHFVIRYFGDSEIHLRFPSAICGTLSIIAIFQLGKKLFTYREGLVSAVFMAALWMPVYYSQEARAYSMLLLTSLVSTCFLIPLLQSIAADAKFSYRIAAGYVISAIICCYTHFFGLYFIALQGFAAFFYFIAKPGKWPRILLIYLPVVLAYLPMAPKILRLLDAGKSWISTPGPFWAILTRYLQTQYNVPDTYSEPGKATVVFIFAILMFTLLVISRIYGFIKSKDFKRFVFPSEILLLLWLLVPFIIIYLKSKFGTPVLTYRNLIICLPASYLLLSRAVTSLPLKFKHSTSITCAVLFILLGLHLCFPLQYYSGVHKQQFREAVKFVVKNDSGDLNSAIVAFGWSAKYFNYYFKQFNCERTVDLLAGKANDTQALEVMLREKQPEYIWYIVAHRRPHKQFIAFMLKNFTVLSHQRFYGAEILLFRTETGH